MAKRKKSKTVAKAKKGARNLWSARDVKLLRKLATRYSAEKIAQQLNRSVAALRYKAHILAVSLRPKYRAAVRVLERPKRKK